MSYGSIIRIDGIKGTDAMPYLNDVANVGYSYVDDEDGERQRAREQMSSLNYLNYPEKSIANTDVLRGEVNEAIGEVLANIHDHSFIPAKYALDQRDYIDDYMITTASYSNIPDVVQAVIWNQLQKYFTRTNKRLVKRYISLPAQTPAWYGLKDRVHRTPMPRNAEVAMMPFDETLRELDGGDSAVALERELKKFYCDVWSSIFVPFREASRAQMLMEQQDPNGDGLFYSTVDPARLIADAKSHLFRKQASQWFESDFSVPRSRKVPA